MVITPLDLPMVIVQAPLAAQVANAELLAPEVRQSMFGPMVAEEVARQAKEEVEKAHESDDSSKVRAEDRSEGRGRHARSRRKRQKSEEEEQPQATTTSNASPWAGNILDVKI